MDKLPKPWRSLAIPSSIGDQTPIDINTNLHNEPCCISGSPLGTNLAHIIPRKALEWFNKNNMEGYQTVSMGGSAIDDPSNLIPLRADIHHLFRSGYLTLVPKLDPADPSKYRLVVHVLNPPCVSTSPLLMSTDSYLEMFTRYQNLECLPLKGVHVEYLFARFAWSLFSDATIQLFRNKSQIYKIRDFKYNYWPESVKSLEGAKVPKPRSWASASMRGKKRKYSAIERKTEQKREEKREDPGDYSSEHSSGDSEAYSEVDSEYAREMEGMG